MSRLLQTNVARTTPSNQTKKGKETMRNALLKSLIVVPVLALVLVFSSSATAEDGPPFVGGGEDRVQGVDYVYPYTFADAEVKAFRNLNTWANQHPWACITSYSKKFDWVMVNGIGRARCTITFQYYFGSPTP